MSRQRFGLATLACAGLIVAAVGSWARADYGITASRPLSDPGKARVDELPTGTWRAVIQDRPYFLHVGSGNIVGSINWMELVLVNAGKQKPSFYLHHVVGFPTKVDGESYFNVAYTSKLTEQLRVSKIEHILSAVERYEIFKYKVTGDQLDVWAADQTLVRKAIEAGELKGSEGRVDDTAENLIRFIKSTPKLFVTKVRYTRIPDPVARPAGGAAATEKRAGVPARAKTATKTSSG